jgi:hypothetical protein
LIWRRSSSSASASVRASAITTRWDRDDGGVLGWFDRALPRCMSPIPWRRREKFLDGFYAKVEEDDGVLMP